ncbi:hypothetical protein AN459_25570 [Pseudomonas aeruginosa]|nr:hypothetical protein BG483_08925 [Pseudomonas aeruginosa]EQL40247.1 hypothetical protein M770_18185 [Pseudomonas aeruginosa VRFPA03]KRV19571.1 hypothetical protein AN459_25570 [Pseudomonas aeruginosa]OES48459.1 hypothetical protein A7R77_32560 [Pseudomonas aeruginosa]
MYESSKLSVGSSDFRIRTISVEPRDLETIGPIGDYLGARIMCRSGLVDVLRVAKISRKPNRDHAQIMNTIPGAVVNFLIAIQENAKTSTASETGVDRDPPFSTEILAFIDNNGVPL